MKKRWTIIILATIAVVAGGMAWLCWPRALPEEECSEVYRQWADVDGVEATFLRGYRVNDSVTVDATLLQASDSAGWDSLRRTLHVPEPQSHSDSIALERNDEVVAILNYDNNVHFSSNDLAIALLRDKEVLIFHTHSSEDKEQIEYVIILYYINLLKNNKS